MLNQDALRIAQGRDGRMGQDRGMNQDGKDERMDQDLRMNQDALRVAQDSVWVDG
ncbi:hypothetical protein [Sphingobacterium mizutaii]|uniref:hypothetical protein n=1 Tax=Sphingobacterium mizutaii TaxID=1010 RepID=UPI0016259116|nr:hypothetical protein [Sphingobacterium mizutaii]